MDRRTDTASYRDAMDASKNKVYLFFRWRFDDDINDSSYKGDEFDDDDNADKDDDSASDRAAWLYFCFLAMTMSRVWK